MSSRHSSRMISNIDVVCLIFVGFFDVEGEFKSTKKKEIGRYKMMTGSGQKPK